MYLGFDPLLTISMSVPLESSMQQNKEDGDILWNLVKDLEFLKYDYSIVEMRPSRFSFPKDTEYSEVSEFSDFGIDVIKDFLHIGLISEDSVQQHLNKNRILLLVWPRFVSPTSYGEHKVYLPGIKRIRTMIFEVPAPVLAKYSNGKVSLNEIIASTAVLVPVEEWKLLERMVISSFYHLTFDKPTTDSHGDINIWQHYSRDKLNKGWQQLLFLCCGPQGLAYLIKRMLKRNWARIVREATSVDRAGSDGYTVFCTGDAFHLLIEWAKFSFKQDDLKRFLEQINSIKPVMDYVEIIERVKVSYVQHISAKKYRCTLCPYESAHKSCLTVHLMIHTGERPFVCNACNQSFVKLIHLQRHEIMRHTGNYLYYCKYCGKPYLDPSSMKYHLSIHEKRGTVQFRCHKCSDIFKDETMLKQHMSFHSNDPVFNCSVCQKKLDSETALLAHSRIHDKERPFNCHICGKGFLRNDHLVRHYNTHSESRQMFPCRFCNKKLKSQFSLEKHEAGQHEGQSMV